MEQPQKAAAKTKSKRCRAFWLEVEGADNQPQLFERIAKKPVLERHDRIQAGEHHRLDFLKAWERLGGRIAIVDDGVADLGV